MGSLAITPKAAKQIKALLDQKGTPQGGLRVGVKGGGCSGLSYFVDWAETPAKYDEIIEEAGARVFVDPKSAMFLKGTTIEYQTSLMQTGFVFQNPNVKTACGCGESFTI